MKMKLVPFNRVGQIILGKPIDLYQKKYGLELLDDSMFEKDTTNLITFELSKSDTSINVDESNRIVKSIMCHEELLYKGKNLVGMTIEEFIAHTGENYAGEKDVLDFEDDYIPQNVYEFETLGLQVWEKGDGGKIVTIIVCQKYEEEEENE